MTPSREKEPVFEVTGLSENVEAARKEIEAHIAIRTGSSTDFGGSASTNGLNGFYNNLNENGSNGDSANDLFSAPSGELYENIVRKRTLVEHQYKSKVMLCFTILKKTLNFDISHLNCQNFE